MGEDGFSSVAPAQVRTRAINMNEQCKTPVAVRTPSGAQSITPSRPKTPLRLLMSPGLSLLSPNDDEEERAMARAARARAQIRSLGLEKDRADLGTPFLVSEPDNILSHDALKNLLQNCLKLSAANKINQGNTWDLKLIDHLSDLVKNDSEDEGRTNFQMASCTLETGVKIYSYRVDSVHSEAYKLMGGLSRNVNDSSRTEASNKSHNENENDCNQESNPMATGPRKVTGTTLESSYEALNAKKIDVAFNVDPLFHQTSAQFDEGGACGLLLNNLSVYRGCEIVFDSHEVPEKVMKSEAAAAASNARTNPIDLSFMKESIDQMISLLSKETEITPTLKDILKLITDPSRAVAEAERNQSHPANGTTGHASTFSPSFATMQDDAAPLGDPGEVDDHVYEGLDDPCINGGFDALSPHSETWGNNGNGLDFEGRDQEFIDEGEIDRPGGDAWGQDPLGWLTVGDGLLGKSNDWAGPGHWKYAKPKSNIKPASTDSPEKPKIKRKKKEPYVVDFENLPEIDRSAFEPSKNLRSSFMPHSLTPASLLLPEDYHFETSSLLKFFLRPSTLCFRRKTKISSGRGNSISEDFTTLFTEATWDDDVNDNTNHWGDGNTHSDVDDGFDMVSQPRKIQKIEVNYDKHSKQVDVRVLKQVLWKQLQNGSAVLDQKDKNEEMDESGLSFQDILKHIPDDCPAAAQEDISVHLCFICLLHLANERNLRLQDCPTMDDLRVFNIQQDS
ncbi:hypothetical protein Mapa_011582 [Marchantia paleacea]|nr:hypothetical protein Mapa_011582 [Marchantia paleacea]